MTFGAPGPVAIFRLGSQDGEAAPSVVDLLRQVLAEQARQRDMLEAILRRLDRKQAARAAHSALLVVIAETIGDRAFTGPQLFHHARVSESLRDALEACDLTSPKEFGWFARRLEASVLPGVQLERVGTSREGVLWRVRVSSEETRVP